jgi:hypothetical protein
MRLEAGMVTRVLALVLALVVALPIFGMAISGTAIAEEPTQIGRLAAISGAVEYHATAAAPPTEASINFPLATGNRITTPPRAHAAVDIAAGRFYIDGDSALTIGTLSAGSAAVKLEKGAVILRILPGGAGQVFVIDTPRGKLRVDQPGYFEVEVTADSVVASALEGGAQFNDSTVLSPGMRVTLAEGAAPALSAVVEDDFIRRIAAEIADAGDTKLEAPTHVSPQTTGFQELEHYGLWVSTERYGWVWEPSVASDWAPFKEGRWVEIAPWGRTWVDNASWAFAPSHYGNWEQVNDRWAWVPGDAGQATPGFFTSHSDSARDAHWVALGPEEPRFTPPPVIVNRVRVINQPPKIVNNTTVNNTTNVTTVAPDDDDPDLFFGGFGGRPPHEPHFPPHPVPQGPRNVTGLGAGGTPMSAGVSFPGHR